MDSVDFLSTVVRFRKWRVGYLSLPQPVGTACVAAKVRGVSIFLGDQAVPFNESPTPLQEAVTGNALLRKIRADMSISSCAKKGKVCAYRCTLPIPVGSGTAVCNEAFVASALLFF